MPLPSSPRPRLALLSPSHSLNGAYLATVFETCRNLAKFPEQCSPACESFFGFHAKLVDVQLYTGLHSAAPPRGRASAPPRDAASFPHSMRLQLPASRFATVA
ncbi:hypothetical protein PsYK624_107740 [Phanerochaete sordida]|uniref:Uncharacterized protein n=1 Tax=Phanerochaete sordida TaxID=48140 RepID=A0A9P3GHW9_9APHY|nr:hypothetical protein PsYK624_107740 [Phanerochaete sordida]